MRACGPAVLSLLLSLALAGDAGAELRAKYGGAVEASLLGAPVTFDPVQVRSHAESTVADLVFDTLYAIGGDNVVRPRLALGAPVFDEKKTTARVELRKGVVFHDGTAVSAQDVAASLERGRTTARWVAPVIVSVRADGDAVEIALAAPTTELTLLLSLPQMSITKGGKPPRDKVIGSGPFQIDVVDPARHRLQLRAFDDYFAGRPYVDRLDLRWYDTPDAEARRFETGNAHLSARGISAFAGGRPTFMSNNVHGMTSLLVYVGFGAAHAAIERDAGFRRAIDLVIARGGLATIGSGEPVAPTRGPLPPESGASALDAIGKTGDLASAQTALAAAQKRVPDLARPNLRLEILVEDTRPDDKEVAERVGLGLDRLGIGWTVTAVSAAAMRERVAKGQTDLYIGQLAEPALAPNVWWAAAFGAGSDDWPLAQLQTGTLDAATAAKTFAERMPIVPLFHRALRVWHRTDVHGVTFDGFGRACLADVFLFGSPVPTKARP